jgi:AraC-like DNA-binding protein
MSSALRPQHFRLASQEHGRFGEWRRTLAGVFDVGAKPDDIGLFDGDIAIWATDQIVLTEIKSSSVRLIRSPETIARSHLDHFALTVLGSGGIAGLAGAAGVNAEQDDVIFLDLSQPANLLTSVDGANTADVTLWIPRARMLSSISDEHALHGLAIKAKSPKGLLIGTCVRSLVSQADHVDVQELNDLANGIIDLTAGVIASALKVATGNDTPAASFVTIRRFIDRNLASPELGPEMIAKKFGLSRASLYRLFDPIGGIAGYIRKQRLNQTFQELTAADLSNQRIGQVAYRFGFKDFSAFSRLFRKTYGVSPREARKAIRKNVAYTVLKADDREGPSLRAWLAQIGQRR